MFEKQFARRGYTCIDLGVTTFIMHQLTRHYLSVIFLIKKYNCSAPPTLLSRLSPSPKKKFFVAKTEGNLEKTSLCNNRVDR